MEDNDDDVTTEATIGTPRIPVDPEIEYQEAWKVAKWYNRKLEQGRVRRHARTLAKNDPNSNKPLAHNPLRHVTHPITGEPLKRKLGRRKRAKLEQAKKLTRVASSSDDAGVQPDDEPEANPPTE